MCVVLPVGAAQQFQGLDLFLRREMTVHYVTRVDEVARCGSWPRSKVGVRRRWLPPAHVCGRDLDAPVFALSASRICRRVAPAAERPGLGPGYLGHSGRVAMPIRMTRNGAPGAAVDKHGCW